MQEKHIYKKVITLLTLSFLIFGCSSTNQKISKSFQKRFTIKSKKEYHENDPIEFEINTGKANGYLSLVYLDKQGKINVLYANKNIGREKNRNISSEGKREVLVFPQDFGDVNITASKNCQNCAKEKTEILIVFSDDPILDIENMSESDLIRLSSKSVNVKNRAIYIGKSRVMVQKVEFFVR